MKGRYRPRFRELGSETLPTTGRGTGNGGRAWEQRDCLVLSVVSVPCRFRTTCSCTCCSFASMAKLRFLNFPVHVPVMLWGNGSWMTREDPEDPEEAAVGGDADVEVAEEAARDSS